MGTYLRNKAMDLISGWRCYTLQKSIRAISSRHRHGQSMYNITVMSTHNINQSMHCTQIVNQPVDWSVCGPDKCWSSTSSTSVLVYSPQALEVHLVPGFPSLLHHLVAPRCRQDRDPPCIRPIPCLLDPLCLHGHPLDHHLPEMRSKSHESIINGYLCMHVEWFKRRDNDLLH